MNLARDWPIYALGLLAVVGGVAGGASGGISDALGGAALVALLGMLVVGPAYLIQQRARRRRGAPAPGGLLGRDANEAITSLTIAELRLVDRHRVASYALTIGVGVGVGVGVFLFLWRTFSLTAAIVGVSCPLLLGIATSVTAVVRVRRSRRGP